MTVTLDDARALPPSGWAAIHSSLLVPAFPDDELVDVDTFMAYREDERADVVVAHQDERLAGVAVVMVQQQCGSALLSHLATDAQTRGGGVGGALLRHAIRRHDPLFMEIEDPDVHVDRGWGDPRRRVAFYHRHGVVAVDVPFFQPPIAPGRERVDGMLLGLSTSTVGDPAELADLVRCFVMSYMAANGDDLSDERGRQLTSSLARSDIHTFPLPAAMEP